MTWSYRFIDEAKRDLKRLDGSQRSVVMKALDKVAQNPLPASEGGYGKPLGNHNQTYLAGTLKIKIRTAGIRVVYVLIRTETEMKIIVIGAREDDEVYLTAEKRMKKYRNYLGV